MSLEKAISQINFEIQQIDELFISFSELFEKYRLEEPSLIELTAIGSVLHSFYNGIENIFKTIGKILMGNSLKVTIGIVNFYNKCPRIHLNILLLFRWV